MPTMEITISDSDGEEHNPDFFGALPDLDPEDPAQRDRKASFGFIFDSRQGSSVYKAVDKRDIFARAVQLSAKELFLLDSDKRPSGRAYHLHEQFNKDLRRRKSWSVSGIKDAVYEIGKEVRGIHESRSEDGHHAAAVELVAMFNYYAAMVEVEEQKRDARIQKARASVATTRKNNKKSLPENWKYDENMLADFDCALCGPGARGRNAGCKRTIVKVDDAADLSKRQSEHEADQDRKAARAADRGEKKPSRRAGPQMRYFCICGEMRTLNGDVAGTNCRECKDRGSVDMVKLRNGNYVPDCRTCRCDCDAGVSLMSDLSKLRLAAVGEREMRARRAQGGDRREKSVRYFGELVAQSFKEVMDNPSMDGTRATPDNAMSAAAAALSRKEMRSDDELHALQETGVFPVPSNTLPSGRDIKEALSVNGNKRGKRYYQNALKTPGGGDAQSVAEVHSVVDSSDPEYWDDVFETPGTGGRPPLTSKEKEQADFQLAVRRSLKEVKAPKDVAAPQDEVKEGAATKAERAPRARTKHPPAPPGWPFKLAPPLLPPSKRGGTNLFQMLEMGVAEGLHAKKKKSELTGREKKQRKKAKERQGKLEEIRVRGETEAFGQSLARQVGVSHSQTSPYAAGKARDRDGDKVSKEALIAGMDLKLSLDQTSEDGTAQK